LYAGNNDIALFDELTAGLTAAWDEEQPSIQTGDDVPELRRM
jgi:hypothetical protein